jgi:hypothetical protein
MTDIPTRQRDMGAEVIFLWKRSAVLFAKSPFLQTGGLHEKYLHEEEAEMDDKYSRVGKKNKEKNQ